MGTPRFPRADPGEAPFWDARYEARFAPWDAGRAPAQLREWAAAQPGPPRTLVPGCGSAWDVRFLAERGWPVTGIDFSAQAVAAAREVLGPLAGRVVQGDFFAPIAGEPFDVVYERAFLCALPRRLWPDWGRRVASLVRPGGELAGFFFFDAGERGPPFPLHGAGELRALLSPAFELVADQPTPDSIDVFRDRERWQVWRRRGPAQGSNSSDWG